MEYALGAGLFLVAVLVGIQWVQSAGESALGRQADNIDYSGSGAGVPSTVTTASTTSTSTTTTMTPPTTASTTTTTPASTTTTTAAPTTTTTTTPSSWPRSDVTIAAVSAVKEGNTWRALPSITWRWSQQGRMWWTTTVTYADGTTGPGSSGDFWINNGTSTPGGGTGTYERAGKNPVVSVTLTITAIYTNTTPGGWTPRTFTVTGPSAVISAP